jgi:hypothetical protein
MTNAIDTFDIVLADIREQGRNQGLGDNAIANAFLRCVRGAARGALDTIKRDADGNEVKKGGRDHADALYAAYVKSYASKDAHSASTVIKGASYFRQGIAVGIHCERHGFDAVAVMNAAQSEYVTLKGMDVKCKKPLEAFVSVAREQLKSSTALTRDEMRDAMQVETVERDAAAYLKTAEKALEKACALNDNDATRDALETTRRAIAFRVEAEQRAADMAKLAELQAKYSTTH